MKLATIYRLIPFGAVLVAVGCNSSSSVPTTTEPTAKQSESSTPKKEETPATSPAPSPTAQPAPAAPDAKKPSSTNVGT